MFRNHPHGRHDTLRPRLQLIQLFGQKATEQRSPAATAAAAGKQQQWRQAATFTNTKAPSAKRGLKVASIYMYMYIDVGKIIQRVLQPPLCGAAACLRRRRQQQQLRGSDCGCGSDSGWQLRKKFQNLILGTVYKIVHSRRPGGDAAYTQCRALAGEGWLYGYWWLLRRVSFIFFVAFVSQLPVLCVCVCVCWCVGERAFLGAPL